jgi:hypothetical protein
MSKPSPLGAVSEFLKELPWADLRKLYERLLSAGQRPNAAAAAVAEIVDELVDLDVLIPGPVGEVLEAVDRPILRGLIAIGLQFSRRGA